jgi:subtilisin family serine protease
MKNKFLKSIMLLIILSMAIVPSVSAQPVKGETIDVIILADRSTKTLVKQIKSLGGSVSQQYKNVTAIAATIPADKLGFVATLGGVTSVQKDEIVYLPEETDDQLHPMSDFIEDMEGLEVNSVDLASIALDEIPEGYANFMYTGAGYLWDTEDPTSLGEGTIVAVVDTGTVPNVCLEHAVIGAPGFPEGFNATEDGYDATYIGNHYHGTFVGGVIASQCGITMTDSDALYYAQYPFLGYEIGETLPVLGQAPYSEIYPVKVFDTTGGGSATSVILDGLDHILTLKKQDLLDIDIVNMSLGGGTLWDGRDAYDRFIEELVDNDMLVVTSAGNEGPTPNSVGSPATSFGAVSVGALDYALSSRIYYEWKGIAQWPLASGQGMIMRPADETRVVNFSSRGPLSDGRFGPEISALGQWNFHAVPSGGVGWASGTSFASPTVAGGAALLNAWWEDQDYETDPEALEEVLKMGADPVVVGEPWQDINDQGYGALDIPASLEILQSGKWKFKPEKDTGVLTANVLGNPVPGKVETWESDSIELAASETFDAVFAISDRTSQVYIEIFDVEAEDNSAFAYWPNALEVHLQSAKRTSFAHPIARYWYPYFYGDTFQILVEDGLWQSPFGVEVEQPMEPGLMKLSLVGDYSNESPVSFKVRVTRENLREPLSIKNRIANGVIKMADAQWYAVEIPEGTTMATFDLVWGRDWASFPTSDIDMIIFDPTFAIASFDGATANAPERAILEDPVAGTWYILIDGYEVNKSDNFDLYLTLDTE